MLSTAGLVELAESEQGAGMMLSVALLDALDAVFDECGLLHWQGELAGRVPTGFA